MNKLSLCLLPAILVGAISTTSLASPNAKRSTNPNTWTSSKFKTHYNRSPLGPNLDQQQPRVLGAHGMQLCHFNNIDASLVRKLMNSQPFAKGYETDQNGNMRPMTSPPTKTALILYDTSDTYGWIGNCYARQMGTICTHFSMPATLLPVEQYTSGMMNNYTMVFYFGTVYQDALPAAFMTDAMTTPKPLLWMGYNLWQIAWGPDGGYNPAFSAKFGYEFNYLDGLDYTTVTYKSTALTANPGGSGLANLTITNSALCTTVATATAGSTKTPYLIRSGNLWFCAENPLEEASPNLAPDRSVCIEDSIHDMINDGVTTANSHHRADIRIEDVGATCSASAITKIGNYMASVKAPYTVATIPHYRDPLGYYNNGVAVDEPITAATALVKALKGMVALNGQISMHGDTHQYDNVPNPNDGVSGDDAEFYIIQLNSAGDDVYVSPTTEDTAAWCQAKLTDGLTILKANGWTATGWTTPDYIASLLDYQTLAKNFTFEMCRGETFTTNSEGDTYFVQQELQWPCVDDLGVTRLPENLGYVSTAAYGVTDQRPANLTSVATKLKAAVRDGWVGMYFHPFLALSLLENLVSGVQGLGYTFVTPGPTWVGQE
jgi:uncharacterized protein YdaL